VTLCAECYYLLTSNEVHLQHFLLVFIMKEADSKHKIKNYKILTFKGDAMTYFHPLNAPLFWPTMLATIVVVEWHVFR